MPVFEATLSDGRIVSVEAEKEPNESDILSAVKQYESKLPSALEAGVEHAAAEALPGAAFVAAAAPGAAYGASLGTPLGPAGMAIGGAIGGMVTGIPAHWAASKLQKKAVEIVAPEFSKEAEEKLRLGEELHPWASMIGGTAALGASARMAPFKMAQLPFRLALGGGMAAGVPLVTEQRLPTLPEFVGGTASGVLFAEPRWAKRPVAAGARTAAPPEEQATRQQAAEQMLNAAGVKWNWIETPIPTKPRDVAVTRPDSSVTLSRPQFNQYVEQYIDQGMPVEKAIRRVVFEESFHAAAYDLPQAKERAAGFWNDFTGLEKMAMRRIIMGERPEDPAARADYDARAQNETYLGLESSRYWMQRISDIGPTEMSALEQQGKNTILIMDRLLGFVRWMRQAFGTRANKRQLEYLDTVENNANRIKKGAQDARSQQEAATVHGTMRAQPVPGVRQVPVEEGGPGVQPQAEGRVVEVSAEEVLLKKKEAYQKGLALLAEARKEPLVQQHLPATNKPLKGEVITGSIVIDEKGNLHKAPHHPAAEEKAGVEPTERREERNTIWYGFSTNKRPFVPRELAGRIAELSGQKIGPYRDPAFPHSDEFYHPTDKTKTLSGDPIQKPTPTPVTKPTPTAEAKYPPKLNPKNPYAQDLRKLALRVLVLERAAGKDPRHQPELDLMRSKLAEVQKIYDAAEKAPPTAPTAGAPLVAPTEVTAKPGVVAPVRPAISKPTPTVEPTQAKPKGPAELAWEQHDELMRQKVKAGGMMIRADRLESRRLLREAIAENPALAEEAPGVTMKGDEGPREPDKIDELDAALGAPAWDSKATKRILREVGLSAKSIDDLNRILAFKAKYAPTEEQKKKFDMGAMLKSAQYPRETIEIATNFASQAEDVTPIGPRPLDWRNSRAVAQWILDHADEMGWSRSAKESLDEIKASIDQLPGVTMKGEGAAPEPRREREEEPWEIQNARRIISEYESGQLSSRDYKSYRQASDLIARYDAGASAGVTMHGRAVPPYTKEEAEEISLGLFPEYPRGSLGKVAESILAVPKEKQDQYVNYLRQQLEEKKAKEAEAYAQLMREQSRVAEIQERIEAGTEKRVPLPPKVEANLVSSVYAYLKDAVRPIQAPEEKLEPTKVTKAVTITGKTVPKLKLETAEEPKPIKVRYALPDPMDWLENVRAPLVGGQPSDPYIAQASNRQLLALYDRTWQNYLHHAPAEAMEQLRQGYRLDRGDLRGYIPEPELDPTLRIFHAFKHGAMKEADMLRLAETEGIDPKSAGWRKQVMDRLMQKVAAKLPEMALARDIDISEPGWEKKLLRGLFARRQLMAREAAKFATLAETKTEYERMLGEYDDAVAAAQRRRSRLERMLLQRGSSMMSIAKKSPNRPTISLQDVQWYKHKSEVGAYAQFAKIEQVPDIDKAAIQWLDVFKDYKTLSEWLVQGYGGIGANATKRVTVLYDTKTGNMEAVSTYQYDSKIPARRRAMLYDPRGEPGKRDRDYLPLSKLPERYRVFGSLLIEDPVGYFHQRWTSDASGSGLKKFWQEVGEVANAAAEGDQVVRRVRRARVERQQRERAEELSERFALTERERRASEELDRLEQQEQDAAREDAEQAMADEGREPAEDVEGEFTVRELTQYSSRLSRISEFQQPGEGEDLPTRVSKMPSREARAFEERNAHGLIGMEEREMLHKDVTPNEAREIGNLFLRYPIRTDNIKAFSKDLEDALTHIASRLSERISGRDYSVISGLRKIAAKKYQSLLRGTGLMEELKDFADERNQTIAQARNAFYKQKQQKAYEWALGDIYDIHAATGAEIAAQRKAPANIFRATARDFPLYPDRFAARVTEAFGDNTSRYLEALSVSPQRAAARAVQQLTDANRLGEVNLPGWVISRDPKSAAVRQKWLKTTDGQIWLRSPEGQKFLRDAGAAMIAAKSVTARLAGTKVVLRELTMKKPGPIPAGTLPDPVPMKKLPVGLMMTREEKAAVREQSQKTGRPRWPEVVGRQLTARTDEEAVMSALSNLEANLTGVDTRALAEHPIKVTVREWLESPEGRSYMLNRWGIRQGPKEEFEQTHERLMRKMGAAESLKARLSEWQEVSPEVEMARGEPGTTMKYTREQAVSGRERREDQYAQLGLPPPEKPKDSYSIAELRDLGEAVFIMGGAHSNPELVMERVSRTGRFSTEDESLIMWHNRELQRDANTLYKDPAYGKDSPEYKAAEQDWMDWANREALVFGKGASEHLAIRQGVQDTETGSWVAMRQELRRVTKEKLGREPSDVELQLMEDMVSEQGAADEAIGDSQNKIRKAAAQAADVTAEVPPEQKEVVDRATTEINEFLKDISDGWQRDQGGVPMAMHGGTPTPLSEAERQGLIAHAVTEMLSLSANNSLSELSWRKTMMKKYPSSTPFLSEIWGPAQQMRDRLVARIIGADKATEIARKHITRTRPTVERSKEIIQRAVQQNPSGRNINPAEAVHAWNIIDQKYFQKIVDEPTLGDFDSVLMAAARDIGISQERLYRALITNKTMRTMTDELYARMDKANQIRNHIRSWLENKEYPWLMNVARAVPRVFFMDKVFGHGFVGMITHASSLTFQPWAWKAYFGSQGGWATMYKMVASPAFHRRIVQQIERDPLYRHALRMGLEVNPSRYTGDYEIGNWYKFLREKTYGRGFDALKKLRLDLFKTWWGALEPSLQTDQMGKLIANDINHLTGIVHTKFPKWANYTFFAPKLAAAQWGVMVTDPIKAATYLAHWWTSTPQQLSWARSQLMHKAVMVGMYYLGLVVNQGILQTIGSNQTVNFDDPKKSDFWSFKVGGFNVGVAGPLIQIVRLFSDMLHIGLGEQSQLEKTRTRGERLGTRLWEYARRKASPFASFAVDAYTGQDFTGRPLPWSSDILPQARRLRGVSSYEWPEYLMQTVLPIPLEEAVKEMWQQMGMDRSTTAKIWHALAVAAPMAGTGARVWQDPTAEEEPEAVRQPVGAY